MKKFAIIMTVFATLVGNSAFAQPKSFGNASQSSSTMNTGMAWGIGLGGLIVMGTVVGLTAGAASNSTSGGTFSH